MSLLTRKRTVLAKIETDYGVDSNPTGLANAMQVKNLSTNPIEAELVSRDLIRPYFGNSEQLLAQTFVRMEFEVEFVGSGVVGKAPAYDPLLRACAFQKTTTTKDVEITSAAGVATVTLEDHGYKLGSKVTLIDSDQAPYNGEKIITAVTADTFSFAVAGGPASPATGTPKLVDSVVYTPISEGIESLTMYYNVDGVLHKMKGARGTVEISTVVKQIPTFKFNFIGLFVKPEDVVAPNVDFAAFMIPELVNTQNTPGFSIFGYSGNMESMAINMANDVQYKTLVGSEKVQILDRQPSGTLVFEAPRIAEKDFFSLVQESTKGALSLRHGLKDGHKIEIAAPGALLGNPNYQDSDGIQMLSAPFTLSPVNGNDEVSLIFT